MRRLVAICAVLGLILVPTCVSWADLTVDRPPNAPSWWNSACPYYAYAWWSPDIISPGGTQEARDDPTHWASNYLSHHDFLADVYANRVSVNLANVYRADYYKEIYIYISGTSTDDAQSISTILNTTGGTFYGSETWNTNGHDWTYALEGEIHPQPASVKLLAYVLEPSGSGVNNLCVTNIWAGENCVPVPVPAAVLLGLLGLGAAGIKLRKFA